MASNGSRARLVPEFADSPRPLFFCEFWAARAFRELRGLDLPSQLGLMDVSECIADLSHFRLVLNHHVFETIEESARDSKLLEAYLDPTRFWHDHSCPCIYPAHPPMPNIPAKVKVGWMQVVIVLAMSYIACDASEMSLAEIFTKTSVIASHWQIDWTYLNDLGAVACKPNATRNEMKETVQASIDRLLADVFCRPAG